MSATLGLRALGTAGAKAVAAAAPPVYDIVVVGAGMAGAALAAALSCNPVTRALSVSLIDRQPPPPLPDEHLLPHADSQVSALTPASIELLRVVGAWRTLAPAAAPVCEIQVWGSGSGGGYVRCSAASIGAPVVASVVESRLVVAALHSRLRAAGLGVRLLMPASLVGAELPPYHPVPQLDGGPLVRLHLADGAELRTRLLVGADGFESSVRRWAQIRSVGQAGPGRGPQAQVELAATVSTSWPLQTAFQRFLPTGPLALLPARGGSVVLWSCTPQMAAQLQALPRADLAAAITEALAGPPQPAGQPPLAGLLGGILQSARSSSFVQPPSVVEVLEAPQPLPLTLQHAGRYVRPRVALLGDAAHGVHRLAGQGVNLGLADARALAKAIATAVETGQDIGSAALLESLYEQPQRRANSAMIGATDALARALQPQAGPLAAITGLGLGAVNALPALKQTLMRLAMHGLT